MGIFKFVSALENNTKLKIPDEVYLKTMYKRRMKYKLNLKNPQTFNEKLQWLKLHDRNPKYTKMVDKYEAKKFVAETIGEEYIIPTIGVYDKFNDIDFSKLPEQFVLKCTHDSGGLVICKDKNNFDINYAKRKIEKSLNTNYFYRSREWPYKNIKPRIIVEKYMEDSDTGDLKDYKFFCFNGKTKCFKVDFNRFVEHHANYYDINEKLLKFGEVSCPPVFDQEIEMPENIEKMIELAEKLSENIPFLRVDFYNISKTIYFGELTFYPASGMGKLEPEEYDKILGGWLQLPSEKEEKQSEK